ncbi:MAG: hypothetical protein K0U20_09000 [Proteobacteria bacterium]|nr:hypothetical protein [Pseudomonadota bacterium]
MTTIKANEDGAYDVNNDDLIPLVDNAGVVGKSVTPNQLTKAIVKGNEDGAYDVNNDDLIPVTDTTGNTPKSVTPRQLTQRLTGPRKITIGAKGDYPDLTTAFPIERARARYESVYSVGTLTLVKGSIFANASGGADFTGVERGSFYIRIVALDLFIPCIVIAPLDNSRSRVNNYIVLKYKWDAPDGDYTYEIVRPLFTHFEILAGHIVEPVAGDTGLVVPNFSTIAGVDRFASIWNGALDVLPNEAGLSVRNLTWGNNEGTNQEPVLPFTTAERAMVRTKGDYAPYQANYFSEYIFDNVECGSNNGERDGLFFHLPSVGVHPNPDATAHESVAALIVRNSTLISYWDVLVGACKNYNIQNNIFKQGSFQDYCKPTGLVMWRNFNASLVDEISLQFQNNDMEMINIHDSSSSCIGIEMSDNFDLATATPDMVGNVSGNTFKTIVSNVDPSPVSQFMRMSSFFTDSNGKRIVSDNNIHDMRREDGTPLTENYFGATLAGVCPIMVGDNDHNTDGSPINITGNFLPSDKVYDFSFPNPVSNLTNVYPCTAGDDAGITLDSVGSVFWEFMPFLFYKEQGVIDSGIIYLAGNGPGATINYAWALYEIGATSNVLGEQIATGTGDFLDNAILESLFNGQSYNLKGRACWLGVAVDSAVSFEALKPGLAIPGLLCNSQGVASNFQAFVGSLTPPAAGTSLANQAPSEQRILKCRLSWDGS